MAIFLFFTGGLRDESMRSSDFKLANLGHLVHQSHVSAVGPYTISINQVFDGVIHPFLCQNVPKSLMWNFALA